jgi:Zn-dependent protease with chaperone function
MLLIGLGMIICFLIAVGLAVYILNWVLLFVCWPILVGVWIGLFRRSEVGYETEPKEKDIAKIKKVIDKLCNKTGQKRPDKIIIDEGTKVAVTGMFRKKIIIGMVALKFMSEQELLIILAHEYGHFANRDTVLGYFTYRIQRFLAIQEGINKANIGVNFLAIIYIPTWFFFWILSRYYALISLWYSRRIEFRADRFAADIVGEQEFSNSLIKYCVVSEIYHSIIPPMIVHYLNQNKMFTNLYDSIKPVYTKKENIDKAFSTVMSDKSSWFSTHPSISERLEMLGISKISINLEDNPKNILENQDFYEKEASMITTNKIAYWVRLVALAKAKVQNTPEET